MAPFGRQASRQPRENVRGWKIALVTDDPHFRVDHSIGNALETVGNALEKPGRDRRSRGQATDPKPRIL
jgi:hypothetical protein